LVAAQSLSRPVGALANAVGVLTGGVNSTLQPRPDAERTINLGKMFRGGPVQRAGAATRTAWWAS
jgi:hypothetical protein